MVFELADELMNYSSDQEEELLICISNVLVSYYEAHCELVATSFFCDFFKDKIKDVRAQRSLNYLSGRSYYTPDVNWIVKVVLDKTDLVSKKCVHYSFFLNTFSILPPFFICEDLYDAHFYLRLAKKYHPLASLGYILENGGGSATSRVSLEISKYQKFALLIVDSDKRYEEMEEGDFQKKCRKLEQKTKGLMKVYVLSVREVENLISYGHMIRVAEREGRDFLKKIKSNGALEALRYCDVKCGTRKSEIMADPSLLEEIEKMYMKVYKRSLSDARRRIQILKEEEYVFPRIKPSLLKDFLEKKNASLPSDINEPERHIIGDLVYTYFVRRPPDPLP